MRLDGSGFWGCLRLRSRKSKQLGVLALFNGVFCFFFQFPPFPGCAFFLHHKPQVVELEGAPCILFLFIFSWLIFALKISPPLRRGMVKLKEGSS